MSGPAFPQTPTRRITVLVAGQKFTKWTKVSIKRGLHEICGSFELTYVDEGRLAATLTTLISPPPYFQIIKRGMSCQILIDDETVLVGWIGKVTGQQTATSITTTISGKDVCGDLVDCAAAPNGPAEWKNIGLLQYATQICLPFNIGVQAQTDTGAPFPSIGISPHDKALPAIEKAARQRAVLVTSDGVGNLLLTTGGSSRAPAPVTVGQNAVTAGFEDDGERRFSDVFVKGQTARANGNHAHVPAPLNVSQPPGGAAPAPSATAAEKAGIVMTGHATDPEITRWRPDVRMVNTQAGASSVQVQAEWHVRIDRGQATKNSYEMQDFRAGPNLLLWRPNQLTAVYDPLAAIDDDMLIEGVEYLYDEGGSRTRLTCVGKTAYDRVNEPARSRPRHAGKTQ